jgi:septum formation protein
MHLILASASPRRAELLQAAGLEFDVVTSHVDEGPRPGESGEGHVRRLAEEKALAVMESAGGERPILAADTVVMVDTEILGKPADQDDATRMLRRLSGRTHEVITGVCLACPAGDVLLDSASTTVEFAPLTDEEIAWYVASGEPADKAGAYAIQGLASRFVTRIAGSYSNVVGLPVAVVYGLCKKAGLLIS